MSEFLRNDDFVPTGTRDPSELLARVCVPVDVTTSDNPEAVVPAVIQLLSALSRIWTPVQLRFAVSAGGSAEPSAQWWIDADDLDTAIAAATNLRTMANAVLVDIRLGEPVAYDPADDDTRAQRDNPPIAVADFVASRRGRADYVRTISAAWRAVREDSVRWTLAMDIDAMPAGGDGDDEAVVDAAALPETPTPTTVPASLRLVGARIRLFSHGMSPAAPAITALFSEDSCGPYGLQSQPVGAAAAPLTWLPVTLAAHLLAAPARMAGGFPAAPTGPADLFAMFEQAATPHILVLGSSGQGKTVLLSHLVHRAYEMGEPACVVDVHDGWLAERAIASAKQHGLRPVVADLSRGSKGPRIRLTTPPPGVDRRQWADELWDVVRHLLWAEMPAEYFGPVGERGVRALIKMAVLDPEETTELADVPALITDPTATERRRALLERIGDADLTNVIQREVMPMVNGRDPGNSATWLLSKLGPLVESWAVRGARDTLGVERAVRLGRPFIIHAPATVLGDSGSRLVVSIALHRLWLAARRRRTPAPLPVLVDEWQLYPSTTVAAMLSQGRKYGVRMRLANQNLAQLSPVLRDTVLGNSGSVVCFRVGPADAALLDGTFPTVPRYKLQTLPRHTVAVTFGDRDLITAAPPPLPEEPPARGRHS
jgi:Helicase HerA, central domain